MAHEAGVAARSVGTPVEAVALEPGLGRNLAVVGPGRRAGGHRRQDQGDQPEAGGEDGDERTPVGRRLHALGNRMHGGALLLVRDTDVGCFHATAMRN